MDVEGVDTEHKKQTIWEEKEERVCVCYSLQEELHIHTNLVSLIVLGQLLVGQQHFLLLNGGDARLAFFYVLKLSLKEFEVDRSALKILPQLYLSFLGLTVALLIIAHDDDVVV